MRGHREEAVPENVLEPWAPGIAPLAPHDRDDGGDQLVRGCLPPEQVPGDRSLEWAREEHNVCRPPKRHVREEGLDEVPMGIEDNDASVLLEVARDEVLEEGRLPCPGLAEHIHVPEPVLRQETDASRHPTKGGVPEDGELARRVARSRGLQLHTAGRIAKG